MQYKTVYFSPTYTTQKTIRRIASIVSLDVTEFDITNYGGKDTDLTFSSDDFVILGIPVYSGRVPQIAKNIISSMVGNNTPIALIVMYGNRHYDDSLLELKTIVQSNGFVLLAAAAFVAEHSVVQKFGANRPNDDDMNTICQFAQQLKQKISTWDIALHTDLPVKGNPNYRKYQSIPIKPHTKSSCIGCGLCAQHCPATAIPKDNPRKTNRNKCVTCIRCIRICPQKARDFYFIEKFIAEKSLKKVCSEYKKSEIFI